jgi:hypothetical protein
VLLQEEAKAFREDKALEYLRANANRFHERFRMPLWISHIGPNDVYAHPLTDRRGSCCLGDTIFWS